MITVIKDTERKIRNYQQKLQRENLTEEEKGKILLKICDLNALLDLYKSIQAGGTAVNA